jgi:hypothetical protein
LEDKEKTSERLPTTQEVGSPGFKSENLEGVCHGAFSDRINLSEKGQALVRNGITLLSSLPNFRPALLPLVQRIERIWIILLKLDEYEQQHPKRFAFKHYGYKATYENSFQRAMALLFALTNQKATKTFTKDWANELSAPTEEEENNDGKSEQSKD